MQRNIVVRRGYDLPLAGRTSEPETITQMPERVAIYPSDFPGFTPKLAVKEGDSVNAGDAVMVDKNHPEVMLTSPVTGTVSAVRRGERRRILQVEINRTEELTPDVPKINDSTSIKERLLASGLWSMMRQRPYDIVPNPDRTPRDIFVTGFDSAPLAHNDIARTSNPSFEQGLKSLTQLTEGKVFVSIRPGQSHVEVPGVEYVTVSGPHPSGLPGVQASLIAPVNKGECIWTLDALTVAKIGRLTTDGVRDYSTQVIVDGPEVASPRIVNTIEGAEIAPIINGTLKTDSHHRRIIAGNVLTGVTTPLDGFLHYPYRQITVIAEGDDKDEFMGWASLSPRKMSVSRSFLSGLLGLKHVDTDARLLGGRRAMIMSGVYDSMMPMDIMVEPLVKAILSQNIEEMEALGIYEIAPEDVALCEWADPSKLELQRIVREGLDYMRKETE